MYLRESRIASGVIGHRSTRRFTTCDISAPRIPIHYYHPVACYSKFMTPVEFNYSISDKETLPIVKGFQNWHHWLKRTKEPIEVVTDYRNLEYFKSPQDLN